MTLSLLREDDPVAIGLALTALASDEVEDATAERYRWLLLGLAYLEKHPEEFSDSLEAAEEMLSDVDFLDVDPELNWYRQFPVGADWNPSQHSYEENLEHLDRNWRKFLQLHRKKYLDRA